MNRDHDHVQWASAYPTMRRTAMGLLLGAVVLAAARPAAAIEFKLKPGGDHDIAGVLNTTLTAGFGIRMQSPSSNLIGKSNLTPNACPPPYQSCQGLFRDQIAPAQHLSSIPGAPGVNGDDGDLNYGKYDLFQAPLKVTSDLKLSYDNLGFFGRTLYFYDLVNNDFTEYHPNRITPQNVDQVGRVGTFLPVNLLQNLPPALQNLIGNLPLVGGRYYGPGAVVQNQRSDGEILRQAGTDMQFLDSYVYGNFNIHDIPITVKLGRQLVNWGESTTLALNSINSANPLDANNFYRIGTQVEEVFTPINMVSLNVTPIENLTVEGFYQLEWKNIEAQTPGTYFSSQDVGTNNTVDNINAGFGGATEDPSCVGKLLDNPLSEITPTCATIKRLPDWEPKTSGQFGIKLDYYAESLNDGTDLSFYYENYHSRLPYASFFATYPSCARAQGNARGNDAANIADFLLDCPDLPLAHVSDPAAATSDTVGFDNARLVLEYPENIHLFGLSFSTTYGDYSFQGEVAYRPNKPMQIDTHDLAFAAFGPSLAACNDPSKPCSGTLGGIGYPEPGNPTGVYGPSDFIPTAGETAFNDTFDLGVGSFVSSARSFPNFVVPYRGGTVGDNPACFPAPGSAAEAATGFNKFSHPYYPYNKNSPCYIQGYVRLQDLNFNIGATRVLGASDNWIGADQVILVYEFGAEYVPNLPSLDELVLQGPAIDVYGPTAGADGSGADGSRMACSTIKDCSAGADGLRFNPHQQDAAGYPTAVSYGYRILSLIHYESVFPQVNVRPTLIWKQDIGGISPGPAGNFVKGRKEVDSLVEVQYRQSLSFNLGYTWFWGGGAYNTLSDRDYAQFFVKYQF